VTRSEILFFSAGMAAGALAHANYPKLKEALGPLVAGALNGAGGPLGDRCAEVVRTVAEKIEAVQDAMAEMSQTAAAATVAGAAAATAGASAATRNGKHEPVSSPV
jgi:hypothetical protein